MLNKHKNKNKQVLSQQAHIEPITKSSVSKFLNEQEEYLKEQKSIHISKRVDYQNLVYLNAQQDFIIKMRKSLY